VNCELQSVWEDTVICSTVHCHKIRQQRVSTFPRSIIQDVWPLVRFLQEPCNKTPQVSPITTGSTEYYMQKQQRSCSSVLRQCSSLFFSGKWLFRMSAESQVMMTDISTAFVRPRRRMQGYKPHYFKTDSFHIPSVSSFKNQPIIDLIKSEIPTAS
jgi:hypothetical protein